MSISTQSFFAQRIAECRASFDKGSLGILRWFGLRIRPSYQGFDRITERMRPHYGILQKQGHVVWGSLAQVNMGMFMAGPGDLPGVTVYSTDPYYDANPQDLFAIGRACFQFKDTEPVDEEFQRVAERLTDEFDATVRILLPKRLTDDREVYLAATMFHRTRLPGGVLRGSLVPLVIAPQATEVNMVLQLPYWSMKLCEAWNTLQATLEETPMNSTAQRVAWAAEKLPARKNRLTWDLHAIPVRVTDAMAAAYHSIAQHLMLNYPPFLFIGLHVDGTKFASFLEDYDRRVEFSFESNGVSVVVRKDQLQRLRGTIVDYQDTLFGRGVLIRLPGE